MKKIDTNKKQSQQNTEYPNKIALQDGENNMPAYNKSIVKKFANFFEFSTERSMKAPSILEFGAGMGSLLDIFRENYFFSPECVEIDPSFCRILQEKNFIVYENTSLIGKKFKCIYTSNVLEHIDDDLDALIKLGRLLQPEGKLAIYTPALPFLFSNLDYQAGHFRRYRKQELISKVQLAGFKVEKCFYNDSLGVIASLVLKVVGYRNKFGLGHGKSLIIYDRFFYPISQLLDALGMRFLGGKNLFLFAVKN